MSSDLLRRVAESNALPTRPLRSKHSTPAHAVAHRLHPPLEWLPAGGPLLRTKPAGGRRALPDSVEPNSLAEHVTQAQRAGRLSAPAAERISRWLRDPAYQEYAAELAAHIQRADYATLEDVFWTVIPFGTGGRRGRMYPIGTGAINDRTIAESARGLADYVATAKPDAKQPSAVVAYDTRRNSHHFAELVAEVLADRRFHVYLFDQPRATPELSFGVRHLRCDCGVMISASHNPPSDNGFKCYWSDGAQVTPPHDRRIIDGVYALEGQPIPRVPIQDAVARGLVERIGQPVDRAYQDAVLRETLTERRKLHVVFTPLHGVGESSVAQVLRRAGFSRVDVLESQRSPDGDFPNVFRHKPNPEEDRAMDPAVEEATRLGADLVLASDPDADRVRAAVPAPDGWVRLTGNQMAALLTDYCLARRQQQALLTPRHFVVRTLVTTQLMDEIAAHYRVQCRSDLLVGFKWIAVEVDRYPGDSERFVFAAEESIGFLAGTYARDKDAAAGALLMADLAADLNAQGRTVLDHLDAIYLRHGYYAESQLSRELPGSEGSAQMIRLMHAFRQQPPPDIAGLPVSRIEDYSSGEVRGPSDARVRSTFREPRGDMLIFRLAEPGNALAARPSGTEPKIKFYFFVRLDTLGMTASQLPALKRKAAERLEQMAAAVNAYIARVLGS